MIVIYNICKTYGRDLKEKVCTNIMYNDCMICNTIKTSICQETCSIVMLCLVISSVYIYCIDYRDIFLCVYF